MAEPKKGTIKQAKVVKMKDAAKPLKPVQPAKMKAVTKKK